MVRFSLWSFFVLLCLVLAFPARHGGGFLIGFGWPRVPDLRCPMKSRYFKPPVPGRAVSVFRLCWLDATNTWGREKEWVEHAVRNWSDVANVHFKFREGCVGGNDVIEIVVKDTVPNVDQLRDVNECYIGYGRVFLNFEYENYMGQVKCFEEQFRENCIKNNAMHEFGHLLGFRHEHSHLTRPVVCSGSPEYWGGEGGNVLTAYDSASIMNYCNLDRWTNPKLSVLDIRGVVDAYGRRMIKK